MDTKECLERMSSSEKSTTLCGADKTVDHDVCGWTKCGCIARCVESILRQQATAAPCTAGAWLRLSCNIFRCVVRRHAAAAAISHGIALGSARLDIRDWQLKRVIQYFPMALFHSRIGFWVNRRAHHHDIVTRRCICMDGIGTGYTTQNHATIHSFTIAACPWIVVHLCIQTIQPFMMSNYFSVKGARCACLVALYTATQRQWRTPRRVTISTLITLKDIDNDEPTRTLNNLVVEVQLRDNIVLSPRVAAFCQTPKTSPQWSGLMCAAARNRENREESIRQIAKSPTQFSHSVCVAVTGCGLAINRIVMFQCTLSAYRMYPRLMPPSGPHSHQT